MEVLHLHVGVLVLEEVHPQTKALLQRVKVLRITITGNSQLLLRASHLVVAAILGVLHHDLRLM